MRVIVLNRKRLGVTVIIVGLMLILFGAEAKFDSRLRQAALMHNNINSLKEYQGLDKTFTYKLPDEWTSTPQNFGGNEIIYHNDFVSQDQLISGFVQVWNLREELKAFIEKGKESSYKPGEFKNFVIEPAKIGQYDGYHVSYDVTDKYGNIFKINEYYFQKNSKAFRMSFHVREKNFRESMIAVFKAIAGTMEYKAAK